MRQNGNHKRPRNRGNLGRKPSNNRNQTFDSNGPSVRIRGNAFQVHEKYLTLARDAYSSGDRVMAENYFQHAEHYYRIVNATTDPSSQGRMNGHSGHQGGYGADDGDFEDEYEPQRQQARPQPRQGGGNQSAPQDGNEATPESDRGDSRQADDRQGGERQSQSERGDRRRRNRLNGRESDRGQRGDGEPQLALDGEQPGQAREASEAPAETAPAAAEQAAPEASEKPRRRRRRPAAAEETAEARDSDEADNAAA